MSTGQGAGDFVCLREIKQHGMKPGFESKWTKASSAKHDVPGIGRLLFRRR